MTFWSGAALILACVLLGMLWVTLRGRVRPTHGAQALYQAQHEALARAAADGDVPGTALPDLQTELARATLEDAAREERAPRPVTAEERYGLGLLVLLALPLVAIPVYLQFGSPTPAAVGTADPAHMTPAEMIAELEARIARAPDDPEPRMWLARVYMAGGRYAEAVEVFEKLNTLAPDQPAVLLQFADALAMTHQGRIGDQARDLIARALALEPDNLTGLWLAGLAADQAGDPATALTHLRRAQEVARRGETPTDELDALIAEIEARGNTPASAATPVATGARIVVAVDVDRAATAGFAPDSVVYVLARAVTGPPMPLAVKRVKLADLPLRVTLDDSLAMSPQLRLSSATEVTVTARISRSGDPIAQSGDLEGRTAPLKVGPDVAVNVRIDTQVP
ncbi:MAG: c-type cytochrome biogenesis protein CcmI [Gammaproteobacteria bacterium]